MALMHVVLSVEKPDFIIKTYENRNSSYVPEETMVGY